MLVWLFALVKLLLVTPALFALILIARRLHRKKRQSFGRRPAPGTTAVDIPAPLTRKKPDWVMHEVLRLKALMGKQVGCRKVAALPIFVSHLLTSDIVDFSPALNSGCAENRSQS